jgi:hypothetical protein
MTNVGDPGRRDDVVVAPLLRAQPRRAVLRRRRHRNDAWLAATGLIGGLLALPLAQNTWHGPEVAAVLTVSATALFAGQRWAIALIVIADLFLLPTVWPRAFLDGDLQSRCVALATLATIVPGVLAMRRAAAVLVVLTGRRRTQPMCRRVHGVLVAFCVVAALLPVL